MSLLDKGCQLQHKRDRKQNIKETYKCCNSLSLARTPQKLISNTKSIDTLNDGNLLTDHTLKTC